MSDGGLSGSASPARASECNRKRGWRTSASPREAVEGGPHGTRSGATATHPATDLLVSICAMFMSSASVLRNTRLAELDIVCEISRAASILRRARKAGLS